MCYERFGAERDRELNEACRGGQARTEDGDRVEVEPEVEHRRAQQSGRIVRDGWRGDGL